MNQKMQAVSLFLHFPEQKTHRFLLCNLAHGISSSNVPLRSNYFNIKVTSAEPNYTNQITYNTVNGEFSVTTDVPTLPNTYTAVATLYRSNSTTFGNVDTYIESYPIFVINNTSSIGGGGGAASTRHEVKVTETENGKIVGPTIVPSGDAETKFVADPEEG